MARAPYLAELWIHTTIGPLDAQGRTVQLSCWSVGRDRQRLQARSRRIRRGRLL